MALADNELFSSGAGRGAEIRMRPNSEGGTTVGTLAAVSGAPTYPKGTPVAFNTSSGFWVAYTQGGNNGTGTIRGFIYDMEGVQTDASGQVQAVILIGGEVHRDDINTAAIRAVLPATAPTESELDAALGTAALRDAGIIVRGLAGAPK
jgi:hypothetical protein